MSEIDWNSKDFESDVSAAMKDALISKKTTQELIREVCANPSFAQYFKQLKNYSKGKRLLFLHRFDLFGIETEMQIPYFHLCKLMAVENTSQKASDSRALQAIVSRETEVVSNDMLFFAKSLGIEESEWKEISEDILDILAYHTISLARKNKRVKSLINAKNFNYQLMKKTLGDYTILNPNVSESKVISKSGVETTKSNDVDPIITSKTLNLYAKFTSAIAKNVERIMDNVPKMIPNVKLQYHLTSKYLLDTIFKKAGLNFEEYQEILDELYRNKLIENVSTISWCESCNLEKPFFDLRQGSIAPSKISKSKCLNCDKPNSYGAIFSLNPTLKDAILSKDGILPVYFGWLLEKEQLKYQVNAYAGEYESDFLINDGTLIECKMLKTEKDLIAIKTELGNTLSQIDKQVREFNKKGIKITNVHLLWNKNSTYGDIQKSFKVKYSRLFKTLNFTIICPDDLENFVVDLKTK